MLKEIIQNNRFSFQKGFSSWEDAIRTACQPLLDQNIITADYPGYIINNVHEFGPYIVIAPEICIPHAQEGKGVSSEYKPRLFFVLASTDNEKHLGNLSELVTLVEDENTINAFVNARSKEDLENILQGIGE